MMKIKKNLFMTACAAALVLAGASCSKDDTLLSGGEGTTTTKVVIREILTVETDTVGQLADKIGSKYETVQKLIVSGPIDATDVRTIRELPELLSLDLKDATLCGGDSTYTANSSTYKLYDNIIGNYMFHGTSLSEIVLPDNIVEIDPYAFYNLTGTSANPFSEIEIPEGVSIIHEYAFYDCNKLTTVKLPSTLLEIEDHCFRQCSSLNSINLEEGLERIGESAFSYCSSLQQIDFPTSLTTLGYDCFRSSG